MFISNTTDYFVYIHHYVYKGENITLKDGTEIIKGNEIIELHINNKKATEINNELKKILRIIERELELLGIILKENEKYKKVKAVYGITALYPLVAKKVFDILDVKPTIKIKIIMFWENLIKYAFQGKKRKMRIRQLKEVWISSQKLVIGE